MIYLDNAATTFHKPKEVFAALSKSYGNPGRGGNTASINASKVIYQCREEISSLFGVSKPQNFVFTSNTTEALNLAIKGLIKKDDHVIVSGMEHNSVIRPIVATGANYSIAQPSKEGRVTADEFEKHIKSNTKLIIATHGSNITGTINPIREIGQLAKRHNILFLVDCAQTAGVLPINVEDDNIDLLAVAGHKLLYGPQGTGGLYIKEGITLTPLKEGGTGSVSESLFQPNFPPDRYESGTLNTNGIAGLLKGVEYIKKLGIANIRQREILLTERLMQGLSSVDNITLYGTQSPLDRTGIVSFNVFDKDSVTVATELDSKYHIACRGGLHCSPLAHESMGTLKSGMVRLSLCHFTTESEIDQAIWAVRTIATQ
ncbi:MAG: aminotransferase class V-fold PLP-dependent enzyme [Eubacteriales bacterium]|nr:aminotransferase class V-fold PLP-dependent enzyme [Eubacteriales bacterium]